MRELALFAGAGGGILGGTLRGWRTVCAVELDAYAAAVLAQRQNDGLLEPFPIWSDIKTFNGYPWQGLVDVVSGGFPCQDISCAGKGKGIEGERSGLWAEMARVVREVRPEHVIVENSPMLTSRGLGVVLGDLAEMGFDAEWGVLGAYHSGAPHRRERIWIAAHSEVNGRRSRRAGRPYPGSAREPEQALPVLAHAECAERRPSGAGWRGDQGWRESYSLPEREEVSGGFGAGREVVAHSTRVQQGRPEQRTERERAWACGEPCHVANSESITEWPGLRQNEKTGERRGRSGDGSSKNGSWWESEPDVGRVAHGVAARVDRLKALGNGQVPAVVRLAWETLSEDLR